MPPRRRTLVDVVRAAEVVLRRNRVDHVFVGGLSVIVFGEPRTTRDVDVIAKFTEEKVPLLAADFRRRGFQASVHDLRAALLEGGHSTLEDTRSPLRIDISLGRGYAAEHSLRHAVRIRWSGVEIPVAPAEHTVVMKLRFGSSQDLEDAFSILTEQWDTVDFASMRSFARHEGVYEALERLLREVESRSKRRQRES